MAINWDTLDRDFSGLTDGQNIGSYSGYTAIQDPITPADKRFTTWGEKGRGDLTGYGTEGDTGITRGGLRDSSARLAIAQGWDGLGLQFAPTTDPVARPTTGQFGGVLSFDTPLVKGQTMHAGMWMYVPADFDFRAAPGFLKTLRFSRSVNSGQKMEVQVSAAAGDGALTGWNLQDEAMQPGGGGERNTSRVLIKGQWNFIAFSAYLSDVPSELRKRLWVNDELVYEQIGETNGTLTARWYDNGWQTDNNSSPNFATLNSAADTVTSLFLFTYWNGGKSTDQGWPATRGTEPYQDQALNIDSVVVHTNEADLGTDASGNKYIASTDVFPTNGFAPSAFTATAVSLDQITLTWTPVAGSLIDIERSLDNVTWTRVYHCPSDDGSCKLFSHEPSTLYYYRARHYAGAGVASAYSSTTSDTTSAANTTYYVRTDGNDGNAGTSDSSGGAYLTIQKALDTVAAGDEIVISTGTYAEVGSIIEYPSSGAVTYSLSCKASGTEPSPIKIRTAYGNEGNVVIDGQSTYGGLHCGGHDYVHLHGLKFTDTVHGSIRNYSQSGNQTPTSGKAQGWVVDRCIFDVATGGNGDNVSHIACWATEDWIIRNNDIRNVTVTSGQNACGIQAYGTINNLVEFNYIENAQQGIFWKDHFLDASGNPYFESEIRYNHIKDVTNGLYIAGAVEQAGENIFKHNIVEDCTYGIYINHKYGSGGQATDFTAAHNVFDCYSNPASYGFWNDTILNTQLEGNIYVRHVSSSITLHAWATKRPTLTASDYQLFDSTFNTVRMDEYSGPTYSSLSAWNAAVASGSDSLAFDSPDLNSATDSFTNIFNTGEYTLKAGSNAIGLMADGSDAGAYQFGVENIGLFVAESSIVSGSTIEANGLTFEIDFSTAITDAGTILPAHFTIAGSTVSAAVLTSSTLVTLTISSTAIEQGDAAPLITYTQPGTGLQEGGVDIPTFETTPVNNSTVDTVAPVLSSPIGTPTGNTTATGTVTTDEGDGTLYYTVTTGTTDTSGNILGGSSQAVSATGSQLVSATGLTAGTNYYFHFLHQDAATNNSVISNSALFTTDAATGPTLFFAQINSAGSSLLLTFSEAVQESGSESAVTLSSGSTLAAPSGGGTNTLTYALSPSAVAGDVVTVSFAGGANVIEPNGGGADTAAFTDEAVTNASTETYPVVLASPVPTIDATGTVLTLYTDDILGNLATPQYIPFSLTGGYTFSNALFTGTGATFTITPEVQQGDVVTLAFTQAGGEFTSTTSGLELQTFSGTAVTNSSTVVTVPPVFTKNPEAIRSTISGHTIRQTLDKNGTVYGVRVSIGSQYPSPSQVKAGLDGDGVPALEAKSVAAVAGQSCSFVFSTGEKNTTYAYYIIAEDSVPNLQAAATQLTATTDNLLFNGSGQGLPAAAPKKKVKMKWDDKKKKR